MSGSFDERNQLLIEDGKLVLFVGKKKSGKSVLAKYMFAGFPWDKVVLDVAGDDGPAGDGVHELHGTADTLPKEWPEDLREHDEPMTLRYVPDAGSPTFLEDMDAVIGLALHQGKRLMHKGRGVLLLVHEIGVVAPANQTKPHMRRALMHNRHNGLSMFMCGPRPMDIDPLVLQQSDVVYAFELPNRKDRARLAEVLGWDTKDVDTAVHALGRHCYLRFDSNEMKPEHDDDPDERVVPFLPLPAEEAAKVR